MKVGEGDENEGVEWIASQSAVHGDWPKLECHLVLSSNRFHRYGLHETEVVSCLWRRQVRKTVPPFVVGHGNFLLKRGLVGLWAGGFLLGSGHC